MARKLKYLGSGEYVPGVPAEDHTCDDNKLAAALVESGSYAYASAAEATAAAGDVPAEEPAETNGETEEGSS
jgi:hypothetical protein